MPYVVVIKSRWISFLLNVEWVSLPIGIGLGASTFLNFYFLQPMEGFRLTFCLVDAAVSIAVLALSMWMPIHRRHGLRRNSLWISDFSK